jgi:hypothetical protein
MARSYPSRDSSEKITANSGDGKFQLDEDSRAILLGVLAGVLWVIWQAIRSTVLALLLILEPIVGLVLSALALLLTLTAFFWKLASSRPDFPFFLVLGSALACFFALVLYRGLIQLLVRLR